MRRTMTAVMILGSVISCAGRARGGPSGGMEWRGPPGYEAVGVGSTLEAKGATVRLASPTAALGAEAAISSSISAAPYRGQRVRIRGLIDATGIDGSAAVWLRTDSTGRLLGVQVAREPRVTGTGTQPSEATLEVPANATVMTFGLLLRGRGTAVVRELRLSVDPRSDRR